MRCLGHQPVSVTSCTDGQSTRAAADQGLAPPDGDRRRMRVEVTDLGREPAERREGSHSTSDEASSNSGSDASGHHVGGVCLLVVCHDLTGPLRDAEREVEKQAFKVINHTSKRVMTNTAQVRASKYAHARTLILLNSDTILPPRSRTL